MKKTTLTLVIDRQRNSILMILKKRGQGSGKWNFPGGKVAPGETAEAAAIREVKEETGLDLGRLSPAAYLEFHFPQGGSWSNTCDVFISEHYSGTLLEETDECKAKWISLAQIPYDQMWPNDRLWVPAVLLGKFMRKAYSFDVNDQFLAETDL